MALATLGIAVPNFVLASMAIILLVFVWGLFPAAGWGSLKQVVLPAVCLGAPFAGYIARLTRTSLLEVLQLDYIRTARAKGLDEHRVHWHHAFRNALFPVITVFGSVFPSIFSGALVVELLFGYQGIGQLVATAFGDNDHPMLFALLMFAAIFTVAGTLMADVLYAWADPRVRYAAAD